MRITIEEIENLDDPVRGAEAAKALEAAARLAYRRCVVRTVAAHRGNMSAAGRELGISPQRVRQIVDGTDSGELTGDDARHEPALYFDSKYAADAALRDWGLAHQDLLDWRNPLIRGARAAGLSERQVHHLTGLHPEAVQRLTAGPITVAVPVPVEVWEALVDRLADLAQTAERPAAHVYLLVGRALAGVIAVAIDETGHIAERHVSLRGPEFEALSPEGRAQRVLAAPPVGRLPDASPRDEALGADAWAAAYCAQLERQAATADATMVETSDARVSQAQRHCAAMLRHIRTHGALPTTEDER